MADPASPDHLPASPNHILALPDHAPSLPDHIPGSPRQEPASPDHVFDFLDDDLAVDIEEDPEEDQDMDIDEEDPEEDQEIDFEDDEDEWEDDDDWLMAPEKDYVHSTFEVGGPSSAAPDAPYPVGRPLSVVASRIALHHQELGALHVLELRYRVDRYPREQVDALRVKDARVEIQDLRTRLSASKSSEASMSDLILRMEERSVIMSPRRMNQAAIKQIVVDRMPTVIAEHEAYRANAAGAGAAGPARARAAGPTRAGAGTDGPAGGVAEANVAFEVHGCTYKSFLNCNPHIFSGTKGVVGLSRLFEKLELVFRIGDCADENRVKLSTCTLQGYALSWWNGYVQTVGIDAAYLTPWTKLKEMMTAEYCPRNEIQKMEIQGNVTSSKPATTHDVIRMAHNLMDQKVRAKAARGSDGNKRNWNQVPPSPSLNVPENKTVINKAEGRIWLCYSPVVGWSNLRIRKDRPVIR
ncbi:hypothetical protein Tco_0206835 [Tanacetum coccineum]